MATQTASCCRPPAGNGAEMNSVIPAALDEGLRKDKPHIRRHANVWQCFGWIFIDHTKQGHHYARIMGSTWSLVLGEGTTPAEAWSNWCNKPARI